MLYSELETKEKPMQIIVMVAVGLHVLAGVFWAGSTLGVARSGAGSDIVARLLVPQSGAAAVAVLTGGYLWHTYHAHAMTGVEHTLQVGAVAALLALVLQIAVAGRALRRRRLSLIDADTADRIVRGTYRASAGLLAITAVAMGVARFV
jgi:hypothetical protein